MPAAPDELIQGGWPTNQVAVDGRTRSSDRANGPSVEALMARQDFHPRETQGVQGAARDLACSMPSTSPGSSECPPVPEGAFSHVLAVLRRHIGKTFAVRGKVIANDEDFVTELLEPKAPVAVWQGSAFGLGPAFPDFPTATKKPPNLETPAQPIQRFLWNFAIVPKSFSSIELLMF